MSPTLPKIAVAPDSVAASNDTTPSKDVAGMGPLELEVYRDDWRDAAQFRLRAAFVKAMKRSGTPPKNGGKGRRRAPSTASDRLSFSQLSRRHAIELLDGEEVETFPDRPKPGPAYPVTAAKVAARLLLARLFDGRKDALDRLKLAAPVVAIDVAERELLQAVIGNWQNVLFPEGVRVMDTGNLGRREDFDVVSLTMTQPPKTKGTSDFEKEALSAICLGLPFIAISPDAESHLPAVVLKADPIRLVLPPIDARIVALAIRVVTGKPCRDLLEEDAARLLTATDLSIGIRFDRSPEECLAQLKRLVALKRAPASVRAISLDDLHGMNEAVSWSKSVLTDLKMWKAGMPWSAIDAGACLVGPPGVGKTTLPLAMQRSAAEEGIKLEVASCSHSQFQGAGEGHLGHFLREMTNFFAAARAKPRPVLVFIDECDSFADRSKLRHSHADYVTACVNGLISELDGISSGREGAATSNREGLILLGASNDLSRCDPAILRSGRLNRIIRIGLPDLNDLEKMYRFRLGGRLVHDDLQEICMLSLGSTGADVERIVKDALRIARHASRDLTLSDLRAVVSPDEDRDFDTQRRVAIHEAGHILMDVLNFGAPENVFANIAAVGQRRGATVRTKSPPFAGTYSDYRLRLETLIAGRTAESLLLSEHSHGSGGRRGSDIHLLTTTAAAMVGSLGLAGPVPLLFFGSLDDTEELMSYPEVRRAAHEELQKAAESCIAKLTAHRPVLEEIVKILLQARRIDGLAVADLLAMSRIRS
ncbi:MULTISPECIES: AAA family ATPase [Bradyrhizobium]|nr:AAA family ATPase [Bradyrhizobium sp. BWC-3-1]WOH62599.1 AAA family ATPase [Bradyrhizobium sp. BWC-3-1]